jgi:RimK family alpha-L-glutamate ligase
MRGRVGIVGWRQTTNEALAEAWQELGVDATLVLPGLALERLAQGDVALARLDVLVTLDGIEPGIEVLAERSARGVRVLNGADGVLGADDKLETGARLQEAGLPRPLTSHVLSPSDPLPLAPPVVVKPRFGSWGVDVLRCETESEYVSTLELVAERHWFRKHGAIVQELVPPAGYDLRLVVAGARVVGAAERVAHPGEWRTNVSLGGTRRPASPSAETQALGIDAARAIGADFVGIDLLPTPEGYVVLELNGAVEFDRNYDLNGADVYDAAATALDLPRTVVSSDTAPIRLRWP